MLVITDYEVEGLFLLFSENKSADQLRGSAPLFSHICQKEEYLKRCIDTIYRQKSNTKHLVILLVAKVQQEAVETLLMASWRVIVRLMKA